MGLRELMFNLGRTGGGGLFIATLFLGVPMIWPIRVTKVRSVSSWPKALAIPKSIIFTTGRLSLADTSTLEGFRSR